FREDLFYRLNVIDVTLPPLRDRCLDILPLADGLLRFFARQSTKAVTGFTPEARAALERHTWPGNLRELRNVVERGVILAAGSEVGLADLPAQLGARPTRRIEIGEAATLDEVECEHIRRMLNASPTLDDAANALGIDPSTLRRKRKRYGL
ncbi:MAG TPA: helix-turn-helix domain-containing protein, partial [Gemmataceae bacterium]